jgi:Uma2 family endonuclease
MSTAAARRLTPDDLLRLPDDGKVYELVDGELKEKPVSKESSRIGVRFARFLDVFCDMHNAGWVYGPDNGFRCFPDDPGRVRKPDVAFVSVARMPVETYEDEGFCTTAPDLVVEVVSPNDLASEVEGKRDEWLAAGVRAVWIVHPETRTVHTHTSAGGYTFLREADTLTAPDLLPGFAVPVADLFRRPTGQPPT